ncbi:phosphotransferase enzyme family protein [Deinococcus marmoris]|uniref:Protein kinase n=1 Tax=Deinococcus marmoris TaxID=249408 RepID=A0A1U7P4C3_9DEIO|nr:phosphotransferase [Deinococcus marmoris]OLV20021.1 protein kinase [Deinococcus marmoris]
MRRLRAGEYGSAMLPAIARKSVAEAALRLLARFEMEGAVALGGFESAVFATPQRVLKLTHTLRRERAFIESELHFTRHLAAHGLPAPHPLPSRAGHWVEQDPDPEGGSWLACAFARLPGHPLRAGDLTSEVIRAWGKLTGQLHVLARHYTPDPHLPRRRPWHTEPVLDLRRLPPGLDGQRRRGQALIERVRVWPRTPQNYGLIQSDLHGDNLHWDGQTLHVFDFDDCEYHFFLNDLAVSLHSVALLAPQGQDGARFCQRFLELYLPAYQEVCALPPDWRERMADLLCLRDVLMLGVLTEAWGIGTPHERLEQAGDRAIVDRYARRVAQGEVICAVDWARL